ncbi:BASIC HELIX LOOP HELIX 68, PERICYCLE FACTOR TYPE-A 3 [Hibiscus trionum]|uniref:BASIC HELIX LOOP HELIX 68, PERICYCLE FACTOR TYPE-A 3 n=1 Tax=Hibiscus trionum TaxID=183268 RepID=A0A9W7IGT0_HIBTR|nr:BASIC HELIX LOOP HELIX 68, PERICYCLE FACTOR TYPE-A 3 [Hibiscus trionum]
MNRGVLQSSPVQQLMAGNHPDWWSINTMRPPPTYHQQPPSPFFPQLPPAFFPQFIPTSTSSWQHDNQELPESWSQLLLGGLVGEEEERRSIALHQASTGNNSIVDTKENYVYAHPIMAAASPPKSCVTTTTTTGFSNNMLDFSGNKTDWSSECNSSTATGGALKKTRVQPSATQSTFKVRKEKLGDRITALHQIVSPFGKTDTASVLLESIGYIRFLHSQIEALSLPYLARGSSANMRQQQQSVQGERNCIFPEDPGQLLNENCLKKRKGGPDDDQQDSNEVPKDLKSRGLCLVPVSCTLQVGSDNGADYWAPPPLGGGFR